MVIKIAIDGSEITGNSKVLNNLRGNGYEDVNINIKNTKIKDKSMVLENVDLTSLMSSLETTLKNSNTMNREHILLREILVYKDSDSNILRNKLLKHLTEFYQGVLASIVANYFSK